MSEPMIWGEDSPRARRTDPVQSQRAADRSSRSRHGVRDAVWAIVRLYGGENPVTGSMVNSIYAQKQHSLGWPKCHFDSPRKRLGELAAEGVLEVVDTVGRERGFAFPEEEQ